MFVELQAARRTASPTLVIDFSFLVIGSLLIRANTVLSKHHPSQVQWCKVRHSVARTGLRSRVLGPNRRGPMSLDELRSFALGSSQNGEDRAGAAAR